MLSSQSFHSMHYQKKSLYQLQSAMNSSFFGENNHISSEFTDIVSAVMANC